MGKIKYLSVCSGIEAASCAWDSLGWEPVAFAEIEPFASSVLTRRYPKVPNLGDFTKIGVEDVRAIDVLVGGTPCQSFSVAGLRGGLGDERGNLALEFLRLAGRLRPRWVVWENVPGVFSATSHVAPDPCEPAGDLESPDGPQDGEEVVVEDEYDADEDHAFSCFLAGLSELGYGYSYGTLDAQHFGVPQRRRRVFVIGYFGDWRSAAAVLFERHSLSGHPAPSRETGQGVAGTLKGGSGERGYPDPSDGNGGGLLEVAGTLGGGKRGWSNDLDRSGAFIPQNPGPYWDGSDIADTLDASNASKQQAMPEKRRFQAVITHSLRGEGFDASEDGTGRGTPLVPVGTFQNTGQGWWNESDVAQSVRTPEGGGSMEANVVAFRAAGQDGFTLDEVSPPIASTDGGGAGVPTIAFSCKDSGNDCDEISPTLRGMSHHGSHANAGGQVAVAFDTTQITSKENRCNPKNGDPCHPLASQAHPPAIAISGRSRGDDGRGYERPEHISIEQSSTLDGVKVDAVAFNLRGRKGGAMAEMAEMASIRSSSGGSSRTYVSTMAVRRLTPKECERLQGFPDGWTKVNPKTADGPRYRVIGNSMAVTVMLHLGQRIDLVEALSNPAHL